MCVRMRASVCAHEGGYKSTGAYDLQNPGMHEECVSRPKVAHAFMVQVITTSSLQIKALNMVCGWINFTDSTSISIGDATIALFGKYSTIVELLKPNI